MQIRIDHATVCGSDLELLQDVFAGVGLITDYGGPHANGLTHMALLAFEDGSYLELIAPIKRDQAGAFPWGDLMLGEAGAGAWAIGVADIHAEVTRLKSLGIQTAAPETGSRRRPDGKQLRWQTSAVGPGAPGALLPFMIQDDTPREWRVQPSLHVKGSGLAGIGMVVLGVKDLDAATAPFRQAYGWQMPLLEDHAEFGAKVAHFPGTPVLLAAPLGEDSALASRLTKFGEIPAAFLLKVPRIQRAAEHFRLNGETKWFGRAIVWFQPEELRGIRLGLVQD